MLNSSLREQVEKAIIGIDKIVTRFVLTETEADEVGQQIDLEIDRRIAGMVPLVAIYCLLPAIQRKAESYFRRRRVPLADAEDLSGKVALKIWRCAVRQGIHGNLNALVAKTRERLLIDHRRATTRLSARHEPTRDLAQLPAAACPEIDEEALECFINALPTKVRNIIDLRREGKRWREVARFLGMDVKEARAEIQRIEWPGGSSLPIRRRSKRLSCRSMRASKSTSD